MLCSVRPDAHVPTLSTLPHLNPCPQLLRCQPMEPVACEAPGGRRVRAVPSGALPLAQRRAARVVPAYLTEHAPRQIEYQSHGQAGVIHADAVTAFVSR